MRNVLAILLLTCWLPAAKAQNPMPLDQLDPSLIPTEERFHGQPKELVAILGSSRGRHWAGLKCLAHSPDGKYLACGSSDGVLCIWDAKTLHEVVIFHAHKDWVFAVAFSPNSHVLASGTFLASPMTKGEVKLWDVPTGKLLATLTGHSGTVNALAFAPNGQLLVSAGADKIVRLWDLTANPPQLHAELPCHEDVRVVAFASDGNTVLSGDSAGELRLWKVPTGKNIATRIVPGDSLEGLAFSGDGKQLVTCSYDKVVRIFDWLDGKLSERFALNHTDSLFSMALSRDGNRLATLDYSATIHLWDLAPQQPREVGAIKNLGVGFYSQWYDYKVAFAPDSKVLSVIGGSSPAVRQWDVSGMAAKERVFTPGPQSAVQFVAWAPDGRKVIAVDEGNKGWIWDRQAKQFQQGIGWSLERNYRYGGDTLAVTADASFLAVHSGGGVQLWDLSIRPPRAGVKIADDPLREGPNECSGLAFAPNGKTLAVSDQEGLPIRLIDLSEKSPKSLRLIENRCGIAEALDFSPDGKALAVGGFDGRQAGGFTDDTVRVYDVAKGHERWSFTQQGTSVQSLCFAPDGRTLAICWRGWHVTLVEVASGKQRAEIQAPIMGRYAIAFSPDSKYLATAGLDGQIAIWEGSQKRWAVQLPGPVAAVAWAPDNQHLSTGNANGTVYVLRVP